MKKIRFKKITAFLLVMCMTLSMLPVKLFAEEETAEAEVTQSEDLADEVISPIIVSEDVTKRGENEKHFLCDDGSYIAVSYPTAVHEQVDGEWVDIEYDVKEDGDGISPADDSIKVKFANNTNSSKLVKLEADEYKISWTVEAESVEGDITEKVKLSKDSKTVLKTAKELAKENSDKIKKNAKYTAEEVAGAKQKAKAELKKLDLQESENIEESQEVLAVNGIIEDYNRQQIQSVTTAQSSIEYEGVFGEGTVLRYILSPGKINEEIVLDSYNGFKSYSMVMDTDGLTPTAKENGRVDLADKNGNTVISIAPPFMYDSLDNVSHDVEVTVTQENKKQWRITYTPDQSWLKDENRAYPVVIDPTVTTNEVTYQNIIDAYVYTGQSASSNMDSHYLSLGYQNNTEYISYIQIQSLPTFPSGALLTGAGLVMKFTEYTDFYQNIGVYAALGNITANNLTWSNKPTVGDFLDNQGSIPDNLWITFCSKTFGSRINNAYKNGTGTLTYAIKFTQKKQGVTDFYSADAPNVEDRPYFTIRYTTEFSNVPEGKYYIRNVNSGLYLNVRGNSTVSGSQVTQMDYSAEPSQIWEIAKAGADTYYIIPQNATNLKLYAPSSGSAVVSDEDHIRNQWRFAHVGGKYTISTVNQPWVVLDVDGQSMSEGATIYPYAYHGYANQKWELIEIDVVTENLSICVSDVFDLDNLGISSSMIKSWSIIDGSNNVSYDSNTNTFVGIHPGVTVFSTVLNGGTVFRLYVTIYYDRYTYELVHSFGFDYDVSVLIRDLYNRIDTVFSNDSSNVRNWKCARLLSEFCYDSIMDYIGINQWNDVAGSVTENETREQYFVDVLGYTSQEYILLNNKLRVQHEEAKENGVIDFCHLQYSLAARLAYFLEYDKDLSNWGTGFFTGNVGYYTNEEISYFAGWLGDAVLRGDGGNTTSFKNDDYMSDLDAENIYHIIIQGSSSVQAFSSYYTLLSNGNNRSIIFKSHIDYDYVQYKVFYELIDAQIYKLIDECNKQGDSMAALSYTVLLNDEEYHWNIINIQYYDTYNFLKNLKDSRSSMVNY